MSYVFPNYPPPLQASEVGLRKEAHIGRGRSSRRRRRRNVFIADIKGWLVSGASIGHQAGRFKKGHGKPRTSTDMLMAIAKNVNCDNIYFLCVCMTIQIILRRISIILWTYGNNVAVNGSIVITPTCHAELTHSRT